MSPNTEFDILARVIDPQKNTLSPEAARSLLALAFSASDLVRLDLLAEKARAGILTNEEHEELESFNHVSHLLALMHSKARLSLQRSGSQS